MTARERFRGGVSARKRRRREPRPNSPLARGLDLVCDHLEGCEHLPTVKLRVAA